MIDTHSHLFAEEFADDLPQVIERAKAAGVRKVFMPNIDDTTSVSCWRYVRHIKVFVIRCWVFTQRRWTVIIKPA